MSEQCGSEGRAGHRTHGARNSRATEIPGPCGRCRYPQRGKLHGLGVGREGGGNQGYYYYY